MTATEHGAQGTPYGPAAGMAPGGPPAPPPGPPGFDWRYVAPVQRPNKWLTVGIMLTALVAVAALAVGITALVTRSSPAPAAPSPAQAAPSTVAPGDTTEADRALCTAIAPLMAENDRFSNGYVDLGKPGTPARDAATPKFISDTLDWIARAQPILDQNPDVDPYFRRSLQRFIDDQHLFVVDLQPGPLASHARALYTDSIGAYSGPLHLCYGLGIKW